MSAVAVLDEGVYLSAYLRPFERWLAEEAVTEILVNRPGEVWVETAGVDGMQVHSVSEVDDLLLERLAGQIARVTHQGVNRERPLLSATLPGGVRVQLVGPPATRRHWALAIRRHRMVDLPLDAWRREARTDAVPPLSDLMTRRSDPLDLLREAVRRRATILISGGTSSGKTTFLNALLREVAPEDRVVLVEDTPEIRLQGANGVGLVAVKGEMGEAKVTTDDLLQASLRLRPDRIVLGELRGTEAVSFLRAVNTGHPGSFTTLHANSPQGALDQLALMVMQAGLGLTRVDIIAYARSVIDVVVQLDRQGGSRGVATIEVLRSAL